MPKTRQTQENNLKRLLALAVLTQGEQDNVVGEISTMEDMILINNQDGINKILTNNDKLSNLKRLKVKEVAEYIGFYIITNQNYNGIKNTTENDWKNHLIRHFQWVQITTPDVTQSQTTSTTTAILPQTITNNIMMSDFPMFNGQMKNWVAFYIEFTSVANI